jgi:cellulose biosynthesis protein BcsQ
MSVIAIYNMKGGVGKTTTAVNLSYLAAASGRRALLWDLDAQGASSFAFRIRARVSGFGRKSLRRGDALIDAIRETDFANLDLLPADFTYRKLDRLLDDLGRPEHIVATLLRTLGQDYDTVFLDCPAGFSLLTEGLFAAADAILVPTIPTILSLRMVARLVKWADRSDSPAELVAFLSMVDRRKGLHRRAAECCAGHREIFLEGEVPYASVVEQMTVRRLPLPAFVPRDPATRAFEEIWSELQPLLQKGRAKSRSPRRWPMVLDDLESLIARLERTDGEAHQPPDSTSADDDSRHDGVKPNTTTGSESAAEGGFVHRFDTDAGDLQRCGYVLELQERPGRLVVVAARMDSRDEPDATARAEVQIDKTWAVQILSGALSPLTALESRLGEPVPLVRTVRSAARGRTVRRIDSRLETAADIPSRAAH